MQFKPITATTVLLLVVASLLVAGCSTSTTSSNNTSGGGGGSVTDTINSAFTNADYLVVTPFSQSVNSGGNTVYKGVVDDGSPTSTPYRYYITIIMMSDRMSAMKEYNVSITQAKNEGYSYASSGSYTSWWGDIGSTSYPNNQVKISVREPTGIRVNPYGTNAYLNLDPNSYALCIVYLSPTS